MDLKGRVGKAIKQARVDKGMTMRELASKIGVQSTNSISRYESGRYNLSLDLLERIANGIGVTVEVLVR